MIIESQEYRTGNNKSANHVNIRESLAMVRNVCAHSKVHAAFDKKSTLRMVLGFSCVIGVMRCSRSSKLEGVC